MNVGIASMNQTLENAIDAYGGKNTWSKASSISAEFSAGGLAFRLKRRPPFNRTKITMDINRPFSRITPIGKDSDIAGILDGPDVRLETANGDVINERKDARQYFPGGRRRLFWDDLDMAYFANYAMWNYLTLPALLLRKDITWTEIEAGRLEATFPAHLPTHNNIQRFHFDEQTGLLHRHDYTAEVIGGLAKAANVILEHSDSDGIKFTSRRKVTPRLSHGRAFAFPTLIGIVVHDYQLH